MSEVFPPCAQGCSSLLLPSAPGSDSTSSTPITSPVAAWGHGDSLCCQVQDVRVCVCLGASQSTKEVWGKRLNSSTDCGADQEFPIAKFRLKLKKVGRTTRLRYDLSRSPYDYRVEVTNRFKGLDLVDREPEERWAEVHDVVQGQESRSPPRKRNSTKQKGCWRGPYK